MDRSFRRGFLFGFVVFLLIPLSVAKVAQGQALREGDLLELDCQSPRSSVPRFLAVQERGGGHLRLDRIDDRMLKQLLRLVEAEKGRSLSEDFTGVSWSPETASDADIHEGGAAVGRFGQGPAFELRHEFSSEAYRGTFSLKCEKGLSHCEAVQVIEQSARDSAREEFQCSVRPISLCAWLPEIKNHEAQRRISALKHVGPDNWKEPFDAERAEKAASFLMDKYSCPIVSP